MCLRVRRILIANRKVNPKECSYGFPWRSDVPCFNFRMPDELVLDSELGNIVDKTEIETLVIGCDLENYDFISDMTNLKYLYIYSGNNISNIDFCEKLVALQQLYIVGSHIDSLDSLIRLVAEKKRRKDAEDDSYERIRYNIEGICIESDCKCIGGKELFSVGLRIGELIINEKPIRA